MNRHPIFPSFPVIDFPSSLNMSALNYNIPQRVKVQLASIRNPKGIVVFWNTKKNESDDPPIDSYRIMMAVETQIGSDVFSAWRSLGDVKAIDLPICVTLTHCKPGYKACFTVVAQDVFGRFGPFSDVVAAVLPG